MFKTLVDFSEKLQKATESIQNIVIDQIIDETTLARQATLNLATTVISAINN